MATIKVDNLNLIFGRSVKEAQQLLAKGSSKQDILQKTGCTGAVNNASFQLQAGDIFVIMGLSGSKKSTLYRYVNRLLTLERRGKPDDCEEVACT